VRECFGPQVLTKERANKFSQRDQAYIGTYYALDKMAAEQQGDGVDLAEFYDLRQDSFQENTTGAKIFWYSPKCTRL
jgi:hypothetical protein